MSAALIAGIAAPVIGGIIGNSASQGDRNKAARLSQLAFDVINGTRIPSPEEQRLVMEELKSAGMYTPQLEEAIVLQSSKMNDIQLDPRLKQAQLNALNNLQEISDNNGLTAIDKAKLSTIQNESNANLKGNVDAIQQNMATRGMSGGMSELVSKQIAAQQSANRTSQQGLDVAAMAQQRALQALMQGSDLAGQMSTQSFNQQAQVAQSNDAISKFNAMNQQEVRSNNVTNNNNAQKYNLANEQDLSNRNTQTRNQAQQYNKELQHQFYEDQLKKNSMLSGQYNNLAADSTAKANRTAQMWAGVGSAIGQGASAYGQQQTEDERLAKYGKK